MSRFFSTLTEYPMCGHGTVGLMTWLVEQGELALDGGAGGYAHASHAGGPAPVEVRRREDGRVVVMLSLDAVDFEPSPIGTAEIAPAARRERGTHSPPIRPWSSPARSSPTSSHASAVWTPCGP